MVGFSPVDNTCQMKKNCRLIIDIKIKISLTFGIDYIPLLAWKDRRQLVPIK